jgi:uncharacterized membrane protein YuzA (DUF378 family)
LSGLENCSPAATHIKPTAGIPISINVIITTLGGINIIELAIIGRALISLPGILGTCCCLSLILLTIIGLAVLIWWLVKRSKSKKENSDEDWDSDDDEETKDGEFTDDGKDDD